MENKRIIIIGGALSGPAAAARVREFDEKAEILLLERNQNVSYATTSLSMLLSGEVQDLQALNSQKADFFRDFYNIQVETGCEVLEIQASNKQLRVSQNGTQKSLAYDRLIVATGVASELPKQAPEGATNLLCFRTLQDLEKIQASLQSGQKKCVVIGAGPMGLEAADGLARAGAQVHLIEKNSSVLAQEQPLFAPLAHKALRDANVQLHLGTTISDYEVKSNKIHSISLSDGGQLECDLLISTIGVRPRTELLAQAGAKLGQQKTVLVHSNCQTSLPDIWACGVAIQQEDPEKQTPEWTAQASLADRSAQIAGANAAGADFSLPMMASTQILRIGDLSIGRIGPNLEGCRQRYNQNNVINFPLTLGSHESYMEKSHDMYIHLYFHKENGQILGAELAGTDAILSRLDILSAMIHKQATVDELALLDLAYAPPYRPVRDPINVCATLASFVRRDLGRIIDKAELDSGWRDAKVVVLEQDVPDFLQAFSTTKSSLVKLRQDFDQLDPDAAYVLVSEYGRKAWLAQRFLMQVGFKNICILGGGIRLYQAMGEF